MSTVSLRRYVVLRSWGRMLTHLVVQVREYHRQYKEEGLNTRDVVIVSSSFLTVKYALITLGIGGPWTLLEARLFLFLQFVDNH